MKALSAALAVLALCAAGSMARAEAPQKDGLATFDAVLAGQPSPPSVSGAPLTLDDVERIALARNPEIEVAVRRVVMAQAHVPTAGALDDPDFMVRSWGVPLSQPWDYNSAQNMLMYAQALPGPGKRGLRTDIARSDVDETKEVLEDTRLRVRVQVRKAFYDLLQAQEELRIHDEHVNIARQAIEAARIRYTVGKVPQQDILKAQLALTQLAEHMIRFDRDAAVARARINTLLGRDPATPIQVTGSFRVTEALPSLDSLEHLALQSRPDLLQAQAALEKSRREQALAGKAYVPDFTLAGGYMLMPPGNTRNNYMLEGSMSLPWLNHRKHDAEINEAKVKVTEQDAEIAALRAGAFGQIQEALAEARAAQRLAAVYQGSLRPQADATLHAAVIAYENNQTEFLSLLDSQMTVIDVDLAALQALADYNARMADLEMAVGTPVDPTQPSEQEKQP